MGPEFFQTRMGMTFYEGTMPSVARNLAMISEGIGIMRASVDKLTKALERSNELKEQELGLSKANEGEKQT